MEYDIKSKPTIYNGTKYRSRLEARWAAFFDLIGWRHQYEPFDLPGWTPDFQVFGSDSRFILFEIKPFIDEEILLEYKNKVSNSTFKGNAILLSNDFKNCVSYGGVLAGYQLMHKEIIDFPFKVHWKDRQEADKINNSQYDIGSLEYYFDGMLFQSSNRKSFMQAEYHDYKKFIDKWVEAGELSRFHYNE